VLPAGAVERLAGDARVAFSVVADAPHVASRFAGKEDIGAQVDRLRRALKAPTQDGKSRRVHVGVDGDEDVGILRHGFVGCQRAEQTDPADTWHRAGRVRESEHGPEQVMPRV
jgi:hypothetical protein